MLDFVCHYRVERWQTARYFDFVKEFLIAAQSSDDSDDCDPPPCPTTPHTVTTEETLQGEWLRIGLPVGHLFHRAQLWTRTCHWSNMFVRNICVCVCVNIHE